MGVVSQDCLCCRSRDVISTNGVDALQTSAVSFLPHCHSEVYWHHP